MHFDWRTGNDPQYNRVVSDRTSCHERHAGCCSHAGKTSVARLSAKWRAIRKRFGRFGSVPERTVFVRTDIVLWDSDIMSVRSRRFGVRGSGRRAAAPLCRRTAASDDPPTDGVLLADDFERLCVRPLPAAFELHRRKRRAITAACGFP